MRLLAREDLRHLLKHKRTYCPQALTPVERRVLKRHSWLREAWFATGKPLRSGWAYGQGYLEGGVEVVEASVGKGKLFLFGPEITFRAQPHGTFKFLFNGIYLAAQSAAATTPTASR